MKEITMDDVKLALNKCLNVKKKENQDERASDWARIYICVWNKVLK